MTVFEYEKYITRHAMTDRINGHWMNDYKNFTPKTAFLFAHKKDLRRKCSKLFKSNAHPFWLINICNFGLNVNIITKSTLISHSFFFYLEIQFKVTHVWQMIDFHFKFVFSITHLNDNYSAFVICAKHVTFVNYSQVWWPNRMVRQIKLSYMLTNEV